MTTRFAMDFTHTKCKGYNINTEFQDRKNTQYVSPDSIHIYVIEWMQEKNVKQLLPIEPDYDW